MASKYLLEGRRAIVTGGASGIGEAIVQAFVKEGAEVLVVDIPESKILNSYNENPNITPVEIDITDQNAPEVVISSAIKSMGGFDVLVNNAGISIPNTIEDDGDDIWERTIAVNVTSIFKISHAALPELKDLSKLSLALSSWGNIPVLTNNFDPRASVTSSNLSSAGSFLRTVRADLTSKALPAEEASD